MPPSWLTLRRRRLAVAFGVSLLFLGALANLMLVAEGEPTVSPLSRPPRTWSGAVGGSESGQEVWIFHIEPEGRRILDVAVDLPFALRAAHVAGTATLESRFGYWVDGERIRSDEDEFRQEPRGNTSDRVRRTALTTGAWDAGDEPLRIDIPDKARRVEVRLTWDWAIRSEPGAEVSFTVEAGLARLSAIDAEGVPGCGLGCARILVVAAFAGQLGAFVWAFRAPDGNRHRPATPPSETEVELEADEPTPTPGIARRDR